MEQPTIARFENIIPRPLLINSKDGCFDVRNLYVIICPVEFSDAKELANELIMKKTKSIRNGEGKQFVMTYKSGLAAEAYELEVGENGINVSASSHSGFLYAVQTLRQVTKIDGKNPQYIIENCQISDAPHYSWRGIMLDESRHFFGKATVKRLLELMSLHKLNVLHWHLTDDQGWRVEIKAYPRLTEIGSKRKASQRGSWSKPIIENVPHEGFYTQEEIKEIVQYAKKLGINIVPEIDMPAHFGAAFAAYGKLACKETETEVPWYFGSMIPWQMKIPNLCNRSACVSKEETYEFIFKVIDEISELFPFEYFHIGGDEAPKGEWRRCPSCKAFMKKNKINNVEKLQGYFTNRVAEYLRKKNKTLIGWNEVLKGKNLYSDVVAQYWTRRRDRLVKKHICGGGKVLYSKHQMFYFDMSYAQVPMKNTYTFTPFFGGVTPQNKDNILGVEGEVWTEWISTQDKMDFQLFPRMGALSEVGWTEERKHYGEFLRRIEQYEEILDGLGVKYAPRSIYELNNPAKRKMISRAWRKDTDSEYKLR